MNLWFAAGLACLITLICAITLWVVGPMPDDARTRVWGVGVWIIGTLAFFTLIGLLGRIIWIAHHG